MSVYTHAHTIRYMFIYMRIYIYMSVCTPTININQMVLENLYTIETAGKVMLIRRPCLRISQKSVNDKILKNIKTI